MHWKWLQKQYTHIVVMINIIVVSHSKILIFMFTKCCCILFCLKPEQMFISFLRVPYYVRVWLLDSYEHLPSVPNRLPVVLAHFLAKAKTECFANAEFTW